MNDIKSSLQQYFGYSEFRPLQKDAITDILNKKDVFLLMPTGGGKSLCYQLPSIIMPGTTIVVSPLISLMKDQVDSLVQNGIHAAYLNSSQPPEQQQDIINKLQTHQLSLLYVAPERLVQDNFLRLLQTVPINFFAIDEAHCISQWGHDFRPEYRQLDILRKVFPEKAVMALTATATPRVKQDIIERLQLQDVNIYQASFNRTNLVYYVIQKEHAFSQLLDFLHAHEQQAGIVYCLSRKTVETVAKKLQQHGIRALPYHAGLSDEQRKANQEKFIRDDVEIIVATIAFGMGINKPNVRFVIHYDLPKSLEHYYQETGRAGRDGIQSECLLLYSPSDVHGYNRFITTMTDETEKRIAKWQLATISHFAASSMCRRKQILNYFAEQYDPDNCHLCDNCLTPKETFDATVLTQKILSCIYRVHNRFGINHIINILTGSRANSVLSYGHNQLSTYNIIQDYDKETLKRIIYELIQLGYIHQTDDKFQIIRLTQKSNAVLSAKEKVFLTRIEEPLSVLKQTERTIEKDTFDHELFQKLRTLRKTLADRANVPPYIIFSDATLREMSQYFPQSVEQFLQISGVGSEKAKKYGEVFTEEINKYCRPRNIQPLSKYRNENRKQKKQRIIEADTSAITCNLFQQGKSLEEIAAIRRLKPETIARHLEKSYLQGKDIAIEQLIPKDKEPIILQAFQTLGIDRLSPIKTFLGDNFSYEELRFVRAKLLRKQKERI